MTFASCLAAALLAVASLSAGDPVGETRIAAENAALHDRSETDAPLQVRVWHPAQDGAVEQAVTIGHPQAPLFREGSVAPGAAPRAGTYPLILLSHGYGGSSRQMTWLGAGLARHGFVVAAVDHPGNHAEDMTANGAALWWLRAADLKATLDAVLGDSRMAPLIDPLRIGAVGYSQGGASVALLTGATPDLARLADFCSSAAADAVCAPQQEGGVSALEALDLLKPGGALAQHAGTAEQSYLDPRVKAAVLVAPAMGQAMKLDAVSTPALVIWGAEDQVTPPATNAQVIASGLARSTQISLPAAHYSWLSACTPAGKEALPFLCVDPADVSREEVHAETIRLAADFLRATLDGDPAMESPSVERTLEDHAAELEHLGRVTVIGGVCASAQILLNDEVGLVELIEEIDGIARGAGMAEADAVAAFQRGLAQEMAIALALLQQAEDAAGQEAREQRIVAYLNAGCAEIVTSYPSLFTLPAAVVEGA